MDALREMLETLERNAGDVDLSREIEEIRRKLEKKERTPTTWDRVQAARATGRMTALDYIEGIFEDFYACHGDRAFGEDRAVVGGLARLDGRPVTVIGIQKGRDVEENIARNFGMPHPEGYRKALRLMRQAEKFKRPVICFIDTPGAYCGLGAEERGQGQAIAENLKALAGLSVPTIAVITGEGGSGGALALALCDRVYMVDRSLYAILSPEGFAAILHKDATKAPEIVDTMKILPEDLQALGIIDGILDTPRSVDAEEMARMARCLLEDLGDLSDLTEEERLERRYQRYRKFG